MSVVFQDSEREAARVAGAMIDVCRREREEIGRGSLDLAQLQEERERLVPLLKSSLPPREARSPELQELLGELRREGQSNLLLLESLRQEASEELVELRRTSTARASYARSHRA